MKISTLIISGLLAVWLPISAAEDNVLDDLSADFDLQGSDGASVALADFRGKNVLVSFGFTHCLHICPMIAANMVRALKATEKDAIGIFISVDTERDTPAITHAYAQGFGDSMIGLSGDYGQVVAAAKNFNVTFVVTKSENNYTVQHTPSIFLLGPDGDLIDSFAMNTPTDTIVSAMR